MKDEFDYLKMPWETENDCGWENLSNLESWMYNLLPESQKEEKPDDSYQKIADISIDMLNIFTAFKDHIVDQIKTQKWACSKCKHNSTDRCERGIKMKFDGCGEIDTTGDKEKIDSLISDEFLKSSYR